MNKAGNMATYNAIEAAVKLGIKKVVIASSETTYGVCFADGIADPDVQPVEEDDDINPMDSYSLSKVVNERRPQTRSSAAQEMTFTRSGSTFSLNQDDTLM